jgi:hypothetical protein
VVTTSKKAQTIDYRINEINTTAKKRTGMPPLGAAKFHFSQSSMTKQRLFEVPPKPQYGNSHLKMVPGSAEKIKRTAGSLLAPVVWQRPTRNQKLP